MACYFSKGTFYLSDHFVHKLSTKLQGRQRFLTLYLIKYSIENYYTVK